jgi:uncharacterized membrane protein
MQRVDEPAAHYARRERFRREAAPSRVTAIDALRGGVMVLMALDHVRDFVHRAAMTSSPTDLATTTPAIFLTRWVTHICAPVFMFTAGLGAYLWWRRGATRPQLSRFLATRGLWLVGLELTVMRLAYNFNLSQTYPVLLIVLWVLGLCMICLAALVWLPIRVLGLASVVIIGLHNCLDSLTAAQLGVAPGLWNLIHQPGVFLLAGLPIIVAYPLVPWVAVIALGFSFGPLFALDRPVRRRYLAMCGAAAIVAFLVVRALNGYGDPVPWSSQSSSTYTILSFLNTTKYPPSLAFLLMTLGPAALALAWLDRPTLTPSNPLVVFGRVPLFYFVVHFYAAHLIADVLAALRYGGRSLAFLFQPVPSMGGSRQLFPPDFGYDLLVVYVVWALLVVALYPVCRWFAGLRQRRRDWWWSYV